MKKIVSQHLVDIVCVIVGIILTIILGQIDTEMIEAYGKGITYVWYAVFSANLMLIPCLTYHHYND